jgi:hypothetical protein
LKTLPPNKIEEQMPIKLAERKMKPLGKILGGTDLRSIGNSNTVAAAINNQAEFDRLFKFLFDQSRHVIMHAADAVEKVSGKNPGYLADHKKELIQLIKTATTIELQWHLALMISRVYLTGNEAGIVCRKLSEWVLDKRQSRIVRVNSLQSLFDLSKQHPRFQKLFGAIVATLEEERVPSIAARIRKLRKQTPKKTEVHDRSFFFRK